DAFLPEEVYDIHVHPYNPIHFSAEAWPFLHGQPILGCKEHQQGLKRYMRVKKMHGLYFGNVHRSAERDAMNEWVRNEVVTNGTELSRALKVVSPFDDPLKTASELKAGLYIGLKVYHIYCERPDSFNAGITEYAPEWMWEI